MTHKPRIETQQINFSSDSTEIYNRPFKVEELESCLSNTKNTASGMDWVYYKMIKNMPDTAKQHLAGMFNKFYKYSFFPIQWNTAIVTAIPKPGKDHSNPSNYRPIALTSYLYKTFERLINDRLLETAQLSGITYSFATIQCGCRRNKSTTYHLVRMEN